MASIPLGKNKATDNKSKKPKSKFFGFAFSKAHMINIRKTFKGCDFYSL